MKKLRHKYHVLRSKATKARAQMEREWALYHTTQDRRHLRRFRRYKRRLKYFGRLRRRTGKALRRARLAHRNGIDMAYGRPSKAAMGAAGKEFVLRYLTETQSMCLTRHELDGWHRDGIQVGMVWEMNNTAALNGFNQGVSDAQRADAIARRIGAAGEVIYFAVDFEVSGARVADYVRGCASVIGKGRTGVYGSLAVVSYALDHGLCDYAWQTYAWSHHAWDHRAQLRQVLIDLPQAPVTVGGVRVDLDKSVKADCGLF